MCGCSESNSSQCHYWCPVVLHTFWRRGHLHTLCRTQIMQLWFVCFRTLVWNRYSGHGLRKLYAAIVNYTAQILCFIGLVWFVITFFTGGQKLKIGFEPTINQETHWTMTIDTLYWTMCLQSFLFDTVEFIGSSSNPVFWPCVRKLATNHIKESNSGLL